MKGNEPKKETILAERKFADDVIKKIKTDIVGDKMKNEDIISFIVTEKGITILLIDRDYDIPLHHFLIPNSTILKYNNKIDLKNIFAFKYIVEELKKYDGYLILNQSASQRPDSRGTMTISNSCIKKYLEYVETKPDRIYDYDDLINPPRVL